MKIILFFCIFRFSCLMRCLVFNADSMTNHLDRSESESLQSTCGLSCKTKIFCFAVLQFCSEVWSIFLKLNKTGN